VMSQHLTTTTQAEIDHHIRLVEAVKGNSACGIIYAWMTKGAAGLEAEIRRREAGKEQDATSQGNH
jgi:hypothetical protein